MEKITVNEMNETKKIKLHDKNGKLIVNNYAKSIGVNQYTEKLLSDCRNVSLTQKTNKVQLIMNFLKGYSANMSKGGEIGLRKIETMLLDFYNGKLTFKSNDIVNFKELALAIAFFNLETCNATNRMLVIIATSNGGLVVRDIALEKDFFAWKKEKVIDTVKKNANLKKQLGKLIADIDTFNDVEIDDLIKVLQSKKSGKARKIA